MKVAVISHDSLSTLNFATWFSRELCAAGVDVTTISSLEPDYAQQIAQLPSRHIDLPLERFVSPLGDLVYVLRLWRVCVRERFDLVITFGTKPNVLGSISTKLAGVGRTVIAIRGRGRVLEGPPSESRGLLSGVLGALYKRACRWASRVWFTNVHDLEYFLSAGLVSEEKAFVTTNSVDLTHFSPEAVPSGTVARIRRELGFADGDFVAVMVARLVWSKGVREFVDAAQQLRGRTGLRFLLVAPPEPGSPDAIPEEYVRTLKDQPNLTWVPFRTGIRDVYAASDISVLPSYYPEGGYPRALLEAMALGKAVVATDTDGCREAVEHGRSGFLVPPRDATALADAIARLHGDASLCAAFGARGKAIVDERFDNDRVNPEVVRQCGMVKVVANGAPAYVMARSEGVART